MSISSERASLADAMPITAVKAKMCREALIGVIGRPPPT
jgi:hypothetical protein